MLLRRRADQKSLVTRVRAPLRLGLAGGGTDLSPYCDEFGGAILNCTIDRFAYAFVEPRTDGRVCFRARDVGVEETLDVGCLDNATLALHRGVYRRMAAMAPPEDAPHGVTVTTTVDAPAGSGLGSSSALVVAMVEAYCAHFELPLGLYEVARLAFEIERIDLGLSGGRQDQYAAAFGGINFIEFLDAERVIVNPLRAPADVVAEFETSLVICFSGRSRESASIINEQVAGMVRHAPGAMDSLHQLKRDAHDMKDALLRGNIDEVARILDSSWTAKKATAGAVSNPHLEELYSLARSRGALAGKVSGAGGGGFMMFIVPPEDRLGLIDALNESGARASPVKFTGVGCETWRAPRR